MAGAVVLAALGLASQLCASVTLSLNASADTFVSNGVIGGVDQSNSNYGAAGAMMVASADLGKGDMQSVIRFDTSSAKSQLDIALGSGQWHITSITLSNGSNFGSAGQQPNNPVFAVITKGNFDISWMENDSWLEGAGNPMNNDTTPGVLTYNNLGSYLSADDRKLGTFTWDAPGSNIARTWNLALDSSLVNDVSAGTAGNQTSFRYSADGTVGFLFNQRNFGAPNAPVLSITADVPEPVAGGLLFVAFVGIGMGRRNKGAR